MQGNSNKNSPCIKVSLQSAKVTNAYHNTVVPEPGGPGGPVAPPIFVRSVNPIRTGEGRLSPPITTGTPKVFHLPAALQQCNSLDQEARLLQFDIFLVHISSAIKLTNFLEICKI